MAVPVLHLRRVGRGDAVSMPGGTLAKLMVRVFPPLTFGGIWVCLRLALWVRLYGDVLDIDAIPTSAVGVVCRALQQEAAIVAMFRQDVAIVIISTHSDTANSRYGFDFLRFHCSHHFALCLATGRGEAFLFLC